MKDSKIKFCPMLVGKEEVKALTIGQGDYVIHDIDKKVNK